MKTLSVPTIRFFGALALAFVFALSIPAFAHADTGSFGTVHNGVEIHITGDGKVLVRGGTVTSVSGSVIAATTAFGSTTLSWTVNTDTNTQFIHRSGGAASIADVTAGDEISFSGSLAGGSGFTVNAKVVKDWSLSKIRSAVSGTITTIATSTNSFTLNTKNKGLITVNVSSTTVLLKNGGTILFSGLVVGDTLTALGTYDVPSTTLAADRIEVRTIAADSSNGDDHKGDKNEGRGGFMQFLNDHFFHRGDK